MKNKIPTFKNEDEEREFWANKDSTEFVDWNKAEKKMLIKGNVWKYGDNINTDEIIPACYLNSSDPEELKLHCMKGIDLQFADKARKGDILVAGDNFGCGSSREHAPISIKAFGISCVVAHSFARIFCRNAINIALPILEFGEAVSKIQEGDMLNIDLSKGIIKNITRKEEYQSEPFPPFMQKLITAGGLIPYVSRKDGLNF